MIQVAALIAVSVLNQVPTDTPAQHEARMHWWNNARFGMFIHWGLYSVPAGKWGNGRNYGEWLREEAHVPIGEYDKLIGQFNPVRFDANEWAKMAKDAGMKYVVITTKHHDGFNLFPSKYTDWSISNTPFKRDIMKELSTAVRRQGMTMGWYHSIMDWHHPDYLPRRSWEVADRPATGADMDRYVKYLHDEVTQLLTDYGPIGVMWFDGEWESTWNQRYGRDLYDLCRKLQPRVIVNNRVSVGRSGGDEDLKAGDYGTPEQYIPATGLPGQDWETCMTMNNHWGYNGYDTDWKSSRVLIRNLVDIASKGGNYLLNVGPKADGTFPQEAIDRLRDIGKWMRVNGDSIYGTTASAFEGLPWGRSTTKTRGDKTTLYLQVFDWPKDGKLVVPGIGNAPIGAKIMGGGSVKVARNGSDLVVDVPAKAPDDMATVVALTVKGAPVIYKAPTIQASTDLIVGPVPVELSGGTGLEVRYTLDGSEPTATSPVYRGPVTVSATTTVKAASFAEGKRVSTVVTKSFRRVTPRPAASVGSLAPGLTVETYDGAWDNVPNFDSLKPTGTTTATAFAVPTTGSKPRENVGQRYSGYVEIPADAVYEFALASDDGSKLWIDGQLVVDNDGLHNADVKTGSIALAKGPHKIVVGYFNRTGGAGLDLKWRTPGGTFKPIAGDALRH